MKLRIEKIIRDEAWLHSGEVAVPFEMTVSDGVASVLYYKSAEVAVNEYLRLFGTDESALFSEKAISWAVKTFGGFLAKYGFSLSPDSEDYYMGYALEVPDEAECGPAVRLTGNEDLRDLTETDISGLTEEGYIICAVTEGNDIVAAANTGEPVCDGTPVTVEIGVDTASEYRRKGYGKACVAALVRELDRLGHRAVYECASGNTASVGLALSLGAREKYKKLYFVGFRDE